MRGSVRILLASVVVLLAMASTTHPAVTDSWYSDSDSVRVEITTPSISDLGIVISGGTFTDDGSIIVLSSNEGKGAIITIPLQDDGVKFKLASIVGEVSVYEPSGLSIGVGTVLDVQFTLVLEGTVTLERV